MPAPASQPAPAAENPPPTSTLNTNRVIPGLNSSQLPPSSSAAKRSRKKKAAASTVIDKTPAVAPGEILEPTEAPISSTVVGGLGIALESPPATRALLGVPGTAPPISSSVPQQTVSPVQQVQKRIRAATKKLQRISGYEASSIPLNEDQKRAIASKPALDATVKELQDLLKILEEDESLDELRIEAVRKEEERKVQGRVDTAIATEQKRAESNLTLLLQFLHLYSLFNTASQAGQGFAPPIISAPVLETATAQEVAAINVLFNQLANGPMAGGGGDAFQSIDSMAQGVDTDVIQGVSFARIKEMVLQLTAPPADTPVQSSPITDPATGPNLSFLQQSEVVPSNTAQPISAPESVPLLSSNSAAPSAVDLSRVSSQTHQTVDHVARNRHLLETAQIVGSDHTPLSGSGWQTNSNKEAQPSVNPSEWSQPHEIISTDRADAVARTIDWAEDVQDVENQDRGASNSYPAPNDAPESTPNGGPHMGLAGALENEGFSSSHPGAGRGGFRGNGGRGGYRGGPRGGHPDGPRGGRGAFRGGGGGYRGGRGGSSADRQSGGWRPAPNGPSDGPGNYRPRADYPGNGYRGRGGPRGGGGGSASFNRPPIPPQHSHPTSFQPEPVAVAGSWN